MPALVSSVYASVNPVKAPSWMEKVIQGYGQILLSPWANSLMQAGLSPKSYQKDVSVSAILLRYSPNNPPNCKSESRIKCCENRKNWGTSGKDLFTAQPTTTAAHLVEIPQSGRMSTGTNHMQENSNQTAHCASVNKFRMAWVTWGGGFLISNGTGFFKTFSVEESLPQKRFHGISNSFVEIFWKHLVLQNSKISDGLWEIRRFRGAIWIRAVQIM